MDEKQRTVTVPVVAADSTNGLFHVDYDAKGLTLDRVEPVAILNAYDAGTAGRMRMGYADANAMNGVIARLVFHYTPAYDPQNTELTLSGFSQKAK